MTDGDYPRRATCPRCGAVVPEGSLWATWCDRCDWNVDAGYVAPAKRSFLDRARQRILDRAAERLRRRASADPDWFRHQPSRLPELALSLVALSGYLAVAAVGVLAALDRLPVGFWRWPLALFCLLVVWALRPQGPAFAATDTALGPDEYPALYETAALVANAVQAAAPDRVAANLDLRISGRAHRLRGAPALLLGLPMWSAAGWETRTAMLAHELAHLADRRTAVGGVVAYSRQVAWDAVHLVWPSEGARVTPRPTFRPLARVGSWLQRGLALPLVGFALLLDRASAPVRLHNEHLADLASARAAGTRAAVTALTSLLGVESLLVPARSALLRGEDPWTALAAMPRRPAREIERLKRAARRTAHRSDADHPPTWVRIELLESGPERAPDVAISRELRARVDTEVAALQQRLGDDFRHQLVP